MKNRIVNAFKVFWWAIKNPKTFNYHVLKLMGDLHALILKVQNENRHMMTRICYVHPEEGEKTIASIWVGAGLDSDPTKRITELIAENAKLKQLLSDTISDNQASKH